MTSTHCTNTSCLIRGNCKKGLPMIDGQRSLFLYPKNGFLQCQDFECLDCHFNHVHGETRKQCRKCGKYENDGIEYICVWEKHGDVRNA